MLRFNLTLPLSLGLATLLPLVGCGGGGGGGGGGGNSFASSVSLVDVAFPDPTGQNSGDEHSVPDNASLIQRITLTFSGAIDPSEVTADGIEVRDAVTRERVPGTFTVAGSTVTFRPALPTRPIVALGSDLWDTGGAGLAPQTIYELTVPVDSVASLPSLTKVEPGVFAQFDSESPTGVGNIGRNFAPGTRSGTWSVRFKTTKKEAGFLTGYDQVVPNLVSTSPLDGSNDLSPKLFTDPNKLFPAFQAYRLVFDQPLDPAADNVGDQTFRLIDLEDENGNPTSGISLGVLVAIVDSVHDRCEVQIAPSGILPFGHKIGITIPRGLRQISGGSTGEKGDVTVAQFTIARAPQGRLTDVFKETFADTSRQETSVAELGADVVNAEWDRNDSHYLQSAFGFTGGGELGPFVPLPPNTGTRTVLLDTSHQALPLFDGSTPGAKPGTVVTGGVYNFTDIVIPDRIIVKGLGRNPLVLTATGSVSIAGVIQVSGVNGNDDVSYDSSITPTPGGLGGPGGGRGGVGHPTIIDTSGDINGDGKPDGFNILNFLPPRYGETGEGPTVQNGQVVYKRIGGRGGESGIKRGKTLDCNPAQASGNDNTSRGGGGGGGTFLRRGKNGKDGFGDTTSGEKWKDPPHDPVYIDSKVKGGGAGDDVFVDADPDNDFIGQNGELGLYMGGQGGGGGGSRLDSYFCGGRYGGFPETVTDSKGGGGGGGGGALVIRALGKIQLAAVTGQLMAEGGWGGRGEQVACGNWGGSAGGGSGGLVILDSATMVTLDDTDDGGDSSCSETDCNLGCDIDISVEGGHGGYPVTGTAVLNSCNACNLAGDKTVGGAGGRGGTGLVQLMVPAGLSPEIGANIFIRPDSGVVKLPPSEISPISVAQSTWIDVGQIINRSSTSPTWAFRGTDPSTGYIITDADGNVPDPEKNTIKVDMLPVLDPVTGIVLKPGKGDFIEPDGSVRVEFQAGDAVEPGSKEVAESSITPWSNVIDVANGHQFMRYRITFNIADFVKHPGAQLSPDSRLATVRFAKMPFDF
ncbi:MAG: Ig-like domain-containing protein [Planctomycetota bacterium]